MSWRQQARCRTADPDVFFDPEAEAQALAICNGRRLLGQAHKTLMPCPVREACLADALRHGDQYGVRGGKTEAERRRLPRQQHGNPQLPHLPGWPPVLVADLWAHLGQPLTRHQAAALVGKNPNYVGRCMNRMVEAGLVARYERQDRIGTPPLNWTGGAKYWYRRVSKEAAA